MVNKFTCKNLQVGGGGEEKEPDFLKRDFERSTKLIFRALSNHGKDPILTQFSNFFFSNKKLSYVL